MSPGKISDKPRVVALGNPRFVGDDYLADFSKDFDFEVLEATNRKETQEMLPAMVAERPIDAFVIRMGTPPYEPFDEDLLKSLLPHCKIITSASAGYNEFDVEWMTANKVWFCNTINAVAESTADMAMFLTLAVLRDTTRGEKQARNGTWKANIVPARDPSGLTLGIVGAGSIGKYLAKKAAAFNMKLAYHNRRQLSQEEEARYGLTYYSNLNDLLAVSDVVSISCPLNKQTTGLISHAQFAAMKDGCFFVNTARGPVVDEEALIQALESGKVARAGLDVFHNEPHINEYFKTSDKVVVQPHMGGLTDVAFQKSERECFENIKSLFKTGRPVAPVNEVREVKKMVL
ncbi:D-3-phosphoglycerate dehydrogenase [Exophiala viscosa]|uniref:D-3-phosphoglycerate dehydrogenase n=1 Tax=Exophiala viscosa TaxID=2486360 RepID=A0AAN6DYB9_9EURO|nr:D-3-phosphoglycerate dehydrogenase [Exophiala viscosa]KAI1626218.1 D-3-phosphoglycerate dehydrogenase [Exophiala viscosa]